jgi:hypothetical protein
MRTLLDGSRTRRSSHVLESGSFRTAHCRPSTSENRREASVSSEDVPLDEVLVADSRAALRPAQLVERKLISMLKSIYLPVSHIRTTAVCTGRNPLPVPPTHSDREGTGARTALVRSALGKPHSDGVTRWNAVPNRADSPC